MRVEIGLETPNMVQLSRQRYQSAAPFLARSLQLCKLFYQEEVSMTANTDKLVAHIRRKLSDLNTPMSDVAYEYAALPLCVIDSVFSIGVRYESTRRTVDQWCVKYRWGKNWKGIGGERTINEFLEILQPYENHWEDMANNVFRNRQRTSTTSGILKAEAVFRFSVILQRFGIQTFADALSEGLRDDFSYAIKAIPGQKSGLSLKYFLILAGHDDCVKADRMVTRFVANALGVQDVPLTLAEQLVKEASLSLRSEFPKLVPRVLDNKIWEYQRNQKEQGKPSGDGCRR
jgi:hypothetical protein